MNEAPELSPVESEDSVMTRRLRPWSVKLLAILGAIPGFVIITLSVAMILVTRDDSTLYNFLGGLVIFVAVVFCLMGASCVLIAYGVWRGWYPAWVLTIVLGAYQCVQAILTVDVLSGVLAIAILALAVLPDTRSYFKREKPGLEIQTTPEAV